MTMPPRTADAPDLDFTATIVTQVRDIRVETDDSTAKLLRQADALIDAAQLQIALGCRDERVWKLLAAAYVGADRVADYGELALKYQQAFGATLRLELPAAVFALPDKINQDSIPAVDAVKLACAAPGGAVLDFSEVRRASSPGIVALTRFLLEFADMVAIPELRGIQSFVASVEAVARTERGSREMWELLLAMQRFHRDRRTYDDLAAQFAARFDTPAPAW